MAAIQLPTAHQEHSFLMKKLPIEIRLNIYELVLGGKTLHVGYPKSGDMDANLTSSTVTRCRASISDKACAVKHRETFMRRHYHCAFGKSSPAFEEHALALLSVCREIYHEAAKIPFTCNDFTFASPTSIANFTQNLTSCQQATLAKTTLYQVHGQRNWAGSSHTVIPFLLTGLRDLTIYIELIPADLVSLSLCLIETEKRENLLRKAEVLKVPSLRRVKAYVVNMIRESCEGHADVQDALIELDKVTGGVREWEGRIEKMVLA